jgi:hypothetical protein
MKSQYEEETLELAGFCARKSEETAKTEGRVVWKRDRTVCSGQSAGLCRQSTTQGITELLISKYMYEWYRIRMPEANEWNAAEKSGPTLAK